jgi:hypothetical protein
MSSKVTFRPLTAVCLLAAAVFVVLAIIYFTRTAADLPSFLPGHQAGSTHHHTKHGIAMLALACLALVGGWFSSAPSRSSSS